MPIIPTSGSAAPRGALVPISSYTVKSSAVGEVVFSSIPLIYQDLYLTANVKGHVDSAAYPYIYFTSFGTGLSATYVIGANGSGSSTRQSGAGSIIGYTGDYLSGLHPTTLEMHVLNYANATRYKTALVRASTDKNNWGSVVLIATQIQSTAAMRLIDFATFTGASNFGVGSTFNLYGVRSIGQ
jgi:hypothetical protein